MFGAQQRGPPTLAQVKKKASRQGNIYFIRTPDSKQERSCYYFEVPEARYLQLQRGSWLLDGIFLERCYQKSYRNTHYYLASEDRWARLDAADYPETEYLLADPSHRASTQVKPPSAAAFKVTARRKHPTRESTGSSTGASSQGGNNSSSSNTQPLAEEPQQEVFEDALDQEQANGEVGATSPRQPEDTEDNSVPHPAQRQERAVSLVWDPIGVELHDQSDSSSIPSAQPSRKPANNAYLGPETSSPTLQNLEEMLEEGATGRLTLQEQLRAEFAANDLLKDERIRHIGKLLAKIDDLNAAVGRSRDYGDIGYPTVLPLCRTIQSPSPAILTESLVKKMNGILHDCGERLTEVLVEAQDEEVKRLQTEVMEAMAALKPTPEQDAAIQLQRRRRRRTEVALKDLPETGEPLPFLLAPDLSKGQRFIVPNREVAGIFSTGTRQPRQSDTKNSDRSRDRNRSKSGHRGQGGSRSHSRGGQNKERDQANQRYNAGQQGGFQGRGRGRGGWRGQSNNHGGNREHDGDYQRSRGRQNDRR